MCINPSPLKTGVSVACRKCWQCAENRIHDWVGRCIAETKTCRKAVSVTLTYGRDVDGNQNHARSSVLTYSDVQLYYKRLRSQGFALKHFTAGEYGSMKGRAHWHAVIFFTDESPTFDDKSFPLGVNFNDPNWPHGYSFWDEVNYKTIRYVCKYLQKDSNSERQSYFAMSKKPPIGSDYFDTLAMRYAYQGLAPQTPFYSFPGVNRGGEPVQFMLRDASLDLFCAAYLRHWGKLYEEGPPTSDLILEYLDRTTKLDVLFRTDQNWIFNHADESARKGEAPPWQNEREAAADRLHQRPSETTKAAYQAASQRSRRPVRSPSSSPSARR